MKKQLKLQKWLFKKDLRFELTCEIPHVEIWVEGKMRIENSPNDEFVVSIDGIVILNTNILPLVKNQISKGFLND